MIDLSALPPPDAVERLDYEEILAQTVADFRARWPEWTAWVESDPALKLLEVCAYREHLLRARVNDAARSCMLAHATEADLDNLAALFGVARLAGEGDAALRRRVVLSLGALNTAGSAAGYEYWARSAGAGIVCVGSTAPGAVRVLVGGAVSGAGAAALDAQPSLALYRAVEAAFARDDVRPVTDTVLVRAMQVQPYRVDATLTLAAGADRAGTLARAEAAVRAYCVERHLCAPPSNRVYRTGLVAALSVAGVLSVALSQPSADVATSAYTLAWPTAQAAARYGSSVPVADPVRQPMDGVAVRAA